MNCLALISLLTLLGLIFTLQSNDSRPGNDVRVLLTPQ